MSSNDIVFDPAQRQVLPRSAAVSAGPLPRFRRRDHERSALVREILDQFNHEAARRFAAVPAPIVDDAMAESIVMFGDTIKNSVRVAGTVVTQHRTTDLGVLPELAIAEPFAVVVSTVRDDAAAALAAMNERPHARRGHRLPAKRIVAPRTASPVWLAAVIVLGALTAAVLLSGVLVNR